MKTLEITTESGTYLVVELPEGISKVKVSPSGWLVVEPILCSYPIMELPSGNWQLIGSGKDHPKLVEELGIYNKNPFHESEKWFHSRAKKRVFKNPVILRKNEN